LILRARRPAGRAPFRSRPPPRRSGERMLGVGLGDPRPARHLGRDAFELALVGLALELADTLGVHGPS
jgi:hypothetical protein